MEVFWGVHGLTSHKLGTEVNFGFFFFFFEQVMDLSAP